MHKAKIVNSQNLRDSITKLYTEIKRLLNIKFGESNALLILRSKL